MNHKMHTCRVAIIIFLVFQIYLFLTEFLKDFLTYLYSLNLNEIISKRLIKLRIKQIGDNKYVLFRTNSYTILNIKFAIIETHHPTNVWFQAFKYHFIYFFIAVI